MEIMKENYLLQSLLTREIDLLYTNIRMFTSFDGGGSFEVTGLAVARNTTRGLMNPNEI